MGLNEKQKQDLSKYLKSDNDYAWYVCYGSNLSIRRLRCYFNGLKIEELYVIKSHYFDKDPNFNPTINKMVKFNYPVYFAQKSSVWRNMGVAFIDLTKQGVTIGRAYKMDKAHFTHLWESEGLSEHWYNQLVYLGELDGLPMLTFTNALTLSSNKPHPYYFNIIDIGLKELIDNNELSKEEASQYLNKLKSL